MSKRFLCPFCNSYFPLIGDTYKKVTVASGIFKEKNINPYRDTYTYHDECIIEFFCCPNCEESTIKLEGSGKQVVGTKINVNPDSLAQSFPEYIPKSIRQDYEEACKIVRLSPKASATLSRRCLQGMIRDYWEISGKNNLFEEIDAIKDKVTPQVKEVLDSVRQIGNIGAHMEKDINLIVDIEPDEAQQLINLIEYLMNQWYIQRHESELMLTSIIDINKTKQEDRKS
ncbi:DUF4145 domain-containing protein [Vagococcus sp. BWB3-3]|uniref:DUF4145 domain-containing protein n=1 Tax=Vagococcus allomyrinae TaxID=2794353 RepID=A0A940SR42_9ENTE|nr:DUF4145 domain-containing protein [Vagococcus allomyrinae]MBP1040392.1 DUF4145 domain-containing protein [Vagococcus allomyrinae]